MGSESNDTGISLHPLTGNLLAVPIILVLIGVAVWPYEALHGVNPLMASMQDGYQWGLLGVLVVGTVLHEMIHGWAWQWAAGLDVDQIERGVYWKSLTPYAHATTSMSARAYRIGAAAPGVVLGLVPLVPALLAGWSVVAGYSTFLLAMAGGDLLMLILMRDLPADQLVHDHPTRIGLQPAESEVQRAEA